MVFVHNKIERSMLTNKFLNFSERVNVINKKRESSGHQKGNLLATKNCFIIMKYTCQKYSSRTNNPTRLIYIDSIYYKKRNTLGQMD